MEFYGECIQYSLLIVLLSPPQTDLFEHLSDTGCIGQDKNILGFVVRIHSGGRLEQGIDQQLCKITESADQNRWHNKSSLITAHMQISSI